MKTTSTTTLCAPDLEKTCFACCPPIRPAGYEHLHYKNMIKRLLRENTHDFNNKSRDINPIIGFSCWALGYLDYAHKQVGCLLHPARNGGKDLRFRIDYGNKCERAFCEEAKRFGRLDSKAQTFWCHLADGLDAFAYSSREENPLFCLLGWGLKLLHLIPQWERGQAYELASFMDTYPFFRTALFPRGHAYLLDRILSIEKKHLLMDEAFRSDFEAFSKTWVHGEGQCYIPESHTPYTHQLDLDRDFLDFIRLSLKIHRIDVSTARQLKKQVDRELRVEF